MEGTDKRQQIEARYQALEQQWHSTSVQLRHKSHLTAWLRLALFIASFTIPYLLAQAWTPLFWSLFGVLFSTFGLLVVYAHRLNKQRQVAGAYLDLYRKETRMAQGDWTNEPDGGEWNDPNHDYAHDLDLFGKGSLFQYLNRTVTREGRRKLADKLKSISTDKEKIQHLQAAIQELSQETDFRESFYAMATLAEQARKKKKDINLQARPSFLFLNRMISFVIMAFPPFSILIISLAAFRLIPSSSIIILFFAGLSITGLFLKQINRLHNEVSALGTYLSSYSRLIALFEKLPVRAAYLTLLQHQLSGEGHSASEIVNSLGKKIQFLDQRLNMLMGAVLNGFLLWDLLACLALKRWYDRYQDHLPQWMDTLHELEALNSFASFTHNHPGYTWPRLSDQIFEATDLGHPLIDFSQRVSNDFRLDSQRRICVITGANMAGKSTFLRTVGVNLVLAGNGCVVAARHLRYKPLTFVTNMRAVDNLLKNESYFFAELNRLKRIVDRLKGEGELFFILDEILKGTNSYDKTNGSLALVKHLLQLNGTGIVATHDLELGHLATESRGQIFNHCFEVTFKGDSLTFDYRLREGITQSHNASFLMRKMGLTPNA